MVKDNDQQKWVRPKAKFTRTVITKKELRPWKCRICGLRRQTKAALLSHEKTHVSKIALSKNIIPSARPGCVLPTELLEPEKRTTREEALYKGRQKGQKAKSRIRDIQKMKQGIKEYEEALESGVTADEYKKNTGVNKSKIFHWRKAVAKKEQSED